MKGSRRIKKGKDPTKSRKGEEEGEGREGEGGERGEDSKNYRLTDLFHLPCLPDFPPFPSRLQVGISGPADLQSQKPNTHGANMFQNEPGKHLSEYTKWLQWLEQIKSLPPDLILQTILSASVFRYSLMRDI